MGSFDDTLRAILREQAAQVTPPVEPVPWIQRGIRRARRRRALQAGAGSVALIGLIAAGVPYAISDRDAEREGRSARIAAAPAKPRTPALTPLPPTGVPEVPAAPQNQLEWPTRGYQPPEPFRRAAVTWYARHLDGGGQAARSDTAKPRRHLLWSGPLPDSRWGMLEQYWTPSGRTGMWNTVLLVGAQDGRGLHAAYTRVTTFNHQRPRESASMSNNEVERIAGYGFGFADFVLVVGSPRADRASVTLNGRQVYDQELVEGAAVFEPVTRGSVELFQLRDHRGKLLTPDDHRSAEYGQQRAVIEGWTLDRR